MGSELGKLFLHDPPYIASGSGSDGQDHTQDQKVPGVESFTMPTQYMPRQSTLQRTTFNPESTSHNSVARFGVGGHA